MDFVNEFDLGVNINCIIFAKILGKIKQVKIIFYYYTSYKGWARIFELAC
jgi:hypothetical protein